MGRAREREKGMAFAFDYLTTADQLAVRWGYAAVFTTFLHACSLLGYALGGGEFGWSGGGLEQTALLFIGNAVVCAIISFFRLRHKMKTS